MSRHVQYAILQFILNIRNMFSPQPKHKMSVKNHQKKIIIIAKEKYKKINQ